MLRTTTNRNRFKLETLEWTTSIYSFTRHGYKYSNVFLKTEINHHHAFKPVWINGVRLLDKSKQFKRKIKCK